MVLIWACLLLASTGTVFGKLVIVDGVERWCDCSYKFYHGCKIVNAAPKGFACHCQYATLWSCIGWPRKCDKDDWCPGGDFSHENCMKAVTLTKKNHLDDWGLGYNCNGVEN